MLRPPVRGDLLQVRLIKLLVLQPAGGDGLFSLVTLQLQLGRCELPLGRLPLQFPHRPLKLKLNGASQVVRDVHPVDPQSLLTRLQPSDCSLMKVRSPRAIKAFEGLEQFQ